MMSRVSIDVAKESSVKEIYDKIKDGSGLFVEPVQTTISESVYYEQGILGGDSLQGSLIANYRGEIYTISDNSGVMSKYKPAINGFVEVCKLPYQAIDVHDTCMVVFCDAIHLLGGYGNQTKSHYKWDGESWKVASTLPYNFTAGKAVVCDNELHIIGGGTTSFDIVYPSDFINNHYRWDGETWEKASDLPYPTWGCTPFYFNGKLHLVGGGSVSSVSYGTVHYVWDGTSWSNDTSAILPEPRFNSSAVVISSKAVYISGGNTPGTSTKLNSVLVYDGNDFIPTFPIPDIDAQNNSGYGITYNKNRVPTIMGRRVYTFTNDGWKAAFSFGEFNNGTACIYGDSIHAFNDWKHYSFSPETKGEWIEHEDNPYSCVGATSVVMDDGIHVMGSVSSAYADYHCLWDGTEWKTLANLPDKLINGTAIVYKGELHIIGGTEMNEKPYNHYKLVGKRWVVVGRTKYDVIGNNAVAVMGDSMYAVGRIKTDDGIGKLCLMKFDGSAWSTISSWEAMTSISTPYAVVYRNRLHVFELRTDAGLIKGHVFTSDNTGNVANKWFDWGETHIASNCIPSIFVAIGYIVILKSATSTSGNMLVLSHSPHENKALEIWIPKNHQFICDKSDFLPIIGNMEEKDNGFLALSTRKYTIGCIGGYENPYTIS